MKKRSKGAVSATALTLIMLASASPAQSELEIRLHCDGVNVVKDEYQTEIVNIWDGRDVCYDIEVECAQGKFYSWATWFEWSLTGSVPTVQWFAVALLDPPAVAGICGDLYEGNSIGGWARLPVFVKKWTTACKFPNGSKFSAAMAEVDGALCGLEDD